jgi:solute:Na+ symporter, SSS family
MTAVDWLLVIVINLGIVIYGVVLIRSKPQTFDYFLASKTLPWWAIGLSAFGTAVDTGDYVAVAGGAYRFGISQLAFWWLGLAVGWFVLSFFVMKAMYRTGMYTNAEWLEFRFGPATRVLAVFINLQSRTNVLGNIYFSVFLVLKVVAGMPPGWAWAVVLGVAVTAVLYIWTGGLRSDVVTDVLQAVPMVVGSFVLGIAVWWSVGGWSGLSAKLQAIDPKLPAQMLHVGGYSPGGIPPTVVVFGMVIALIAYAVINQYEAIRFLGARSEWDYKMAAVVASVVTAITLWFNITMGPLAKVDFPALRIVDEAYPLMIKKYLPAGLVGIVVAGLVAAAYSTFDSIGIGLSSLFVRDIYARFFVQRAADAHYALVGRISVPVIIALGFVYVPFLGAPGMFAFYIRLAGAISVPLMTVMLMGVFTRVHRDTGIIGLVAGLVYGISAILADFNKWGWPVWYVSPWWAYVWNIVLPAVAMVVASWVIDRVRGPVRDEELEGLLFASRDMPHGQLKESIARRLKVLEGTWLQKTLREAPSMPRHPFPIPARGLPWYQRPERLAWGYIVVVCFVLFFILW